MILGNQAKLSAVSAAAGIVPEQNHGVSLIAAKPLNHPQLRLMGMSGHND